MAVAAVDIILLHRMFSRYLMLLNTNLLSVPFVHT